MCAEHVDQIPSSGGLSLGKQNADDWDDDIDTQDIMFGTFIWELESLKKFLGCYFFLLVLINIISNLLV